MFKATLGEPSWGRMGWWLVEPIMLRSTLKPLEGEPSLLVFLMVDILGMSLEGITISWGYEGDSRFLGVPQHVS